MEMNVRQVLKELCQDLGYKKKGYLFYTCRLPRIASFIYLQF